jgi:signal transduction histidine kinase
MQDWTDIAGYVGFGPEDEELLRAFWPYVAPHVTSIVDHFYERIMATAGTRQVLADPQQVERLKRTLGVWLQELLEGPHDAAYVTRRQRIGWRHVQVGLDGRYVHAAMQVLSDDLLTLCLAHVEGPAATWRAVQRVLALDLAIMTSSFVNTRERQSFESLQELLVTHLRTMVLLVDAAGLVVAATRSTREWLGGGPVVGRPWDQVLPEGLVDTGHLKALVGEAVDHGEARSHPRVDIREAGAPGTRSYRVDVVPITHPLATLLVQVEELTEVVELEGRMRRSEALAQLGALSAAVAHELRNPLAGISGALQVILRTVPKDAPYAPVMVKVEREIHRLDALVTDLLAFARPGAVRLREVNLREPVGVAVDWTREDHPEVLVEVLGEGTAQADADMVQQIVMNLLQNAVQAMAGHPNGGPPRIVVTLGPARIEVSDAGPGIPAELGERIFEPFTTTKTRGTGLGLAICTRSAAAMGATLSLGRGPLPGACFVLDFAGPR